MKRLDDSSDSVRKTAVRLLCELFGSPWPSDYPVDLHRPSVDALYDTMLLHLDDPEPAFQDLIMSKYFSTDHSAHPIR